jgi:hypothetical protein
MRFFQRTGGEQPNNDSGGQPGSGDVLQQARERGDRLLAAGDEAIRRALSGNSQNFITASRQQGGQ